MPICEVCEDESDETFEIVLGGRRYVLDTFECAIRALPARCGRCRQEIPAPGSACAACGGVDPAPADG